jgi:hypothetical protein
MHAGGYAAAELGPRPPLGAEPRGCGRQLHRADRPGPGGDRTGTYRAGRVTEALVLRTMEGRAVAKPGDWVVEGCRGDRWPVSDAQFRRSYAPGPEA